MTKDEALTMIIASIAMEELALSHILNAEGEKLQYVLGTLPGGHGACASTQEILAVNKSVNELMDTVMQSQMLLKGKLEKALEAGGHRPPPGPCGPCSPETPPCGGGGPCCTETPPCGGGPCCPETPPCGGGPCCTETPPCGSGGPCCAEKTPCGGGEPCCTEKTPCGSGGPCCTEKTPCGSGGPCCTEKNPCGSGRICCQKSAVQLVSRGSGFSWGNGTPMSWKCRGQTGCGIRWNENAPTQVRLDSGKTYLLSYIINTCGSFPGDNAGSVCVNLTPCNAFWDILPLYFSVKCLECRPLTLHCSAILFPKACPPSSASLSLLLNYRDSLLVDQASLSIVEL